MNDTELYFELYLSSYNLTNHSLIVIINSLITLILTCVCSSKLLWNNYYILEQNPFKFKFRGKKRQINCLENPLLVLTSFR